MHMMGFGHIHVHVHVYVQVQTSCLSWGGGGHWNTESTPAHLKYHEGMSVVLPQTASTQQW